MERAFPNPSKKENHRKREGAKRLPLVGNEGGKKHRQKPEFPLTGAGLLMEDAEKTSPRLQRSVSGRGLPRWQAPYARPVAARASQAGSRRHSRVRA